MNKQVAIRIAERSEPKSNAERQPRSLVSTCAGTGGAARDASPRGLAGACFECVCGRTGGALSVPQSSSGNSPASYIHRRRRPSHIAPSFR